MQTNHWFRVINSLWTQAKFYNNWIFHGCATLFFNRAFSKNNGLISNVKHTCTEVYFLYIFSVLLTDPKGQLKSVEWVRISLDVYIFEKLRK